MSAGRSRSDRASAERSSSGHSTPLQVILTDLPEALDRCRLNLKRNRAALKSCNITAVPLDWCSERFPNLFAKDEDKETETQDNRKGEMEKDEFIHPDLILTADCVYNRVFSLLRGLFDAPILF